MVEADETDLYAAIDWLQRHGAGACTFIITVQARGAEADSAPVRLKIAWDGSWHDGAQVCNVTYQLWSIE